MTFGPNRSEHRNRVPEELKRIFEEANRAIASYEANPDDENYERAAFHIAVWLHAKTIAVHPFQDGNGRSSRLLMNVVLVRVGLRPVPVEIPKEEYLAAMNHFIARGDIEPLIDVLLECVEHGCA